MGLHCLHMHTHMCTHISTEAEQQLVKREFNRCADGRWVRHETKTDKLTD